MQEPPENKSLTDNKTLQPADAAGRKRRPSQRSLEAREALVRTLKDGSVLSTARPSNDKSRAGKAAKR